MILTLGHSTHSAEDFAAICRAADIHTVIDVRSHPHSSHSPQWNRDQCSEWLPAHGVQHEWHRNLGGWDARHGSLDRWARERGTELGPYLQGHFPKQRIAANRGVDYDHLYDHLPEQFRSRWSSVGLHDYATWMLTDEFRDAVDHLIERFGDPAAPRACLTCSESCWWCCHRSMIADLLAARGVPVSNVMPRNTKTLGWRIDIRAHNAQPRLDRYSPEWRERWGIDTVSHVVVQ